jgi:leucyl-tRNA synthetase
MTQVGIIDLKYSDSAEATSKIREECCPGVPYIVFGVSPSLSLTLINPQPQNGHFTQVVNVRDGDNVAKLTTQISRGKKLDHAIYFMSMYCNNSEFALD